jgi:hypothetical protein
MTAILTGAVVLARKIGCSAISRICPASLPDKHSRTTVFRGLLTLKISEVDLPLSDREYFGFRTPVSSSASSISFQR